MIRRFAQVDVFTDAAFFGNPLAVVFDADDLDTDEMQRIANWTNLSETTFVLQPTKQGADYRVRIFTGSGELPFAGHPTLGTCHAWLELAGTDARGGDVDIDARGDVDVDTRDGDVDVVQECGAGLIRIARIDGRLAFEAPELRRSGPVDQGDIAEIADTLGIAVTDIVAAEWADNGPGWVAVALRDASAVLALVPKPTSRFALGVVGRYPSDDQSGADVEVRAFYPDATGLLFEDPVTGSLNASIAQWLLGSGRIQAPYVASQGTKLGRRGRVFVTQCDGIIRIGGDVVTCVSGTIRT